MEPAIERRPAGGRQRRAGAVRLAALSCGLLLPVPALLSGCAAAVLSPAGPVGEGERIILLDSLAIMLVIGIPTIVATTAPDNANNILALAFGVLIVCLVVFGSLWVMEHLNRNMVALDQLLQMQH